jgi:hypothetical protein
MDFIVPQNDNTARDGGGNAGPVAVYKSLLVRGPEVLGNLWEKAGRAGRLRVMREETTSHLNSFHFSA